MTLCIAFREEDGSITTLADSRLTLTRQHGVSTTDKAIKIHIASHSPTIYAGSRYDIVFAISGTLSLGLQSVMYVDACLQGVGGLWVDWMLPLVERKLGDFWGTAINKDVSYAICLRDHKRNARIFEWIGDDSSYEMREVKEEHGVLLSVTGESASELRDEIMAEIARCCYVAPAQAVVRQSSIRTLIRAIRDSRHAGIGGVVQGAQLRNYEARYFIVQQGGRRFLRSAELEDWEIAEYPVMDLDAPELDVTKPLPDLLRKVEEAR